MIKADARAFVDIKESEYDRIVDVDQKGQYFLVQAAARSMIRGKKGGKVVTVASVAYRGEDMPKLAMMTAYNTAKAGVVGMTRGIAKELKQYGINVNAIAPGYMDTEMNVALTDPKNPKFTQQRYDELTQRIPAHRWGTPDDMKGCCIFLASHASDYLGGAIIPVDGGYLVM